MKKLLILFAVTLQMLWADSVVYSLTSGDYDTVQQRLVNNVENLEGYYKSLGKKLDVAVVIHGHAYDLFLKEPPSGAPLAKHAKLKAGLKQLQEKYGVVYDICSMGMKKRHIAPEAIYGFVHPVFNKDAGLIKWQSKGYAYIEIE